MLTDNSDQKVIVSLTSFPAALKYAVKAIESILRGSMLPDRIVLYLTASQIQDSELPEDLLELLLKYDIFEIRYCSLPIRSYTKLIPALQDFPEDIIVTIDDDIDYHADFLRDLLNTHRLMPDAIVAHRVRRVSLDKPYRKWRKYYWYNFFLKKLRPSFYNLLTGVGGVLYPPHSLYAQMLDPELFMSIAPTADDIWFWAAAVANDVKVMPVPYGVNHPRELNKPNDIALMTINYRGAEDRNTAVFNAILDRYPEIKARLVQEKNT